MTSSLAPVAGQPIMWRGRPVPWVTAWSTEQAEPEKNLMRISGGRLRYGSELMADRDSRGILWIRYSSNPGEGEPLWSMVHAGRHRQSMRSHRCQVCSTPLDRGRTPWLFPADEWDDHAADVQPRTTMTPPCCEGCWDAAERLCPHLIRQGRPAWRGYLIGTRRWGVLADLYAADGSGAKTSVFVRDGTTNGRLSLAKQVVVTWDSVTPV